LIDRAAAGLVALALHGRQALEPMADLKRPAWQDMHGPEPSGPLQPATLHANQQSVPESDANAISLTTCTATAMWRRQPLWRSARPGTHRTKACPRRSGTCAEAVMEPEASYGQQQDASQHGLPSERAGRARRSCAARVARLAFASRVDHAARGRRRAWRQQGANIIDR
jgi:hypothetical protein